MKAPVDISPPESTWRNLLESHPISAILEREFEEWKSAERLKSFGEDIAMEIQGGRC